MVSDANVVASSLSHDSLVHFHLCYYVLCVCCAAAAAAAKQTARNVGEKRAAVSAVVNSQIQGSGVKLMPKAAPAKVPFRHHPH